MRAVKTLSPESYRQVSIPPDAGSYAIDGSQTRVSERRALPINTCARLRPWQMARTARKLVGDCWYENANERPLVPLSRTGWVRILPISHKCEGIHDEQREISSWDGCKKRGAWR
jgi:hypothetical protein